MSLTRLAVPPLILALIAAPVLALPTANAAVAPSGPTVTVSGTVTDTAGNPVAGASVHASRTQVYALTNSAGTYTLTGVPDGSSEVVAAKEGFAFTSVVRNGTTGVTVRMPAQTQPPRREYPRPDADRRPFTNQAWQSLNGTWSFDFDPSNTGEQNGWQQPNRQYTKAIQVPFPYQSLAAFGEQGLATADVFRSAFDTYNGAVWYRRSFTVPTSFTGQHTRLRIGAAYWGFTVWEDGALVQPSIDYGDTEWVVDLGALAPGTTHTLVIKVTGRAASGNSPFPIGRQDRFANKGGIWQSVWIEPVKAGQLATPQVITDVTFNGSSRTPSAASATVKVQASGQTSGTADVTIRDPAGQQVASGTATLTNGAGQVQLAIPQPKLWDIKLPNLYTADVVLTNGDDGVRVTFGLRKVERKAAPSSTQYQYIWLNNRPVYLRGALDQGLNPWGTATPTGDVTGPDFVTGTEAKPGQGSIVADLKNIQAQGYNLVRAHVKVFDPEYYYWADKLGLMVWLEMPNSGREQMFDNGAALFNQFKPRYEGLLRSALAINRNRPSVVIWTTFNEGWGVVRPFGDLAPEAIPFIKDMVALIRAQNPGVLVNDNSACCENGHTSVTDINDVHAGLGGIDQWTPFLNDYNAGVFPGSTANMAEGSQSGQPWLMSEATIDRGAQLTNFSMYRSYPKIAGYVVVQYEDQEDEMASQFTYDRLDRGAEFVDHNRVKRAADLANGDDAVSIMRDSLTTTQPGESLTFPVKVSHFSDADLTGAQLRWKVAGRDANGNWIDPGVAGSKPINPTRYTVTDAGTVSVTIPASVHTGYVWVWMEAGGQTAAENLITFTDETPAAASFDPMSPINQSWTGGTQDPEFQCGPEIATGYGSGLFEYTATVPAAAQSGGTLTFEASSAEAPNPNDGAFFTGARKFQAGLTITVDGQQVQSTVLPDDPGDALGITSRMIGRYNFPFKSGIGNHYGYRVAVPLSAALLNGKTTVTVRLASNGGGLRVFGAYAGDHALPPRIVAGAVASQVPAPAPTVPDRPHVSFTPAALSASGAGTAVVSVMNDTAATITGVQTRLHLPPGWSATPIGSPNVGSLPPAGHAHVQYAVQAPGGAGNANATATVVWNGRSVQSIGIQPPFRSPTVVSEPAGASYSLSGDGRAEPICVNRGGTVVGQLNTQSANPATPLTTWPYTGTPAVVATGMTPGGVWFADLDGDGKSEIIAHRAATSELVAWRNVRGFASTPWGGSEVVIGTGITDPSRYHFADLNGDRKADLEWVQPNGEVKAWRNGAGFAAMPWNADAIIATGFTDPVRVRFMDLNADRKAEIASIGTDGTVTAWRNASGFATLPYAESVPIATGMTEPQRVKFADLNADGKAEIVTVERHGFLRAWRNAAGFATAPWAESAVIGYGFMRPEQVLFG